MSAIAEHRAFAILAAAVLGAALAWSGCGSGSGGANPSRVDDGGPAGCRVGCAGTCTGSGCLATLASGQYNPEMIAVDSKSAYWPSGNGVMKVALDGGIPVTLAGVATGVGIAVDDASVYWANTGRGNAFTLLGDVQKVSLSGGTTTTLAPGYTPELLTVDRTNVYWTDLGTCPSDGGPCEQQTCPSLPRGRAGALASQWTQRASTGQTPASRRHPKAP